MRKPIVSLVFGYICFAAAYGQQAADSARFLYEESYKSVYAGDFSQAESYLAELFKYGHTLSVYQMALVHNRLGFVYSETGRLREALEEYRIAEVLTEGADTRFIQLRISIHINQGLLYNNLGDYTNALEYNNEAERLLRSVPAWDSISYVKLSALLLNNGIVLNHLGRHEEAREVLEECAQIKKTYKHSYLGSVYFNLARVYLNLGDPELAHQNYLKGIEQWTSEYDSDYFELANIYLHFGQFLNAQGKPEEGFEYLQKALQNYLQNYDPGHPLTAACYEAIARYFLNRCEFEKSLEYLQLALHSIAGSFKEQDLFSNPEPGSASHDPTLLRILATKTEALERISAGAGTTEYKRKYTEAALSTNLLSLEVLQQIRNAFLSSESRMFMSSRQKDLFTAGIRLNLRMFRLSGQERFIEEAFLMAAKGKSGELMFEMKNKEWLYLESLSDTMAISAIELRQQIDYLSNLIQSHIMDMNPDSVQLVNWQDQLFQTRDSFNRHMEQLRRDLPQIGQFEPDMQDFSLEQIRRSMKHGESLVEYFIGAADSADREQLFIFVVSRQGCQYYQSTLDSAFRENLETIMDKLHLFVPYNESRERFDSLKLALYGAYQELVEPVESFFRGRNLLIVPDETLSYIPFDALITRPDPDSIANYAGISYLLQDYNISYIYNSQLIAHKRPRDWRFPRVTAWIPEQAGSPVRAYGKLSGAEQEVGDILKLVQGRCVQQIISKPELAALLQESSILHLAMHSLATEITGKSPYFILDTVADPLLGNRMHDYDINALKLSAPMVVLSSCETAGGPLKSGEGIMSLSRSFLQAGAASVVHTLWPVDDVKSREIMIAYYRELKKGRSKSRALSNVKRQYMLGQPPFYTHPYYWAAFQISGDNAPLNLRRSISIIPGSVLLVLLYLFYLKRRSFFRRP
ncbi:MAG: CHAT domain-containing protein [Bacteroidales bacterium]|nr:CHAT domain-containing protein [Bacteroidales bacterium]